MLRRACIVLLSCAACMAGRADSAGADIDYMPEEVPSGEECDTDATPSEACRPETDAPPGAAGSPCDGSMECNDGLICAAPFDRGERGTYACVAACIGAMDEARWCADAGACCDPEAICTARGYCIASDPGESTGSVDTDAEATGTSTGSDATG
jgi:hypothetical protein